MPGVESVGYDHRVAAAAGRTSSADASLTLRPDAGTRAAVQSVNDELFLRSPDPDPRRTRLRDVGPAWHRACRGRQRHAGAKAVAGRKRDRQHARHPSKTAMARAGSRHPTRRRESSATCGSIPADIELADAYVPVLQTPGRFVFALIRTAGAPEGWLPQIRAAFRDIDPEIAVQRSRPLAATIDEVTARPRFLTWLLSVLRSHRRVARAGRRVRRHCLCRPSARTRDRRSTRHRRGSFAHHAPLSATGELDSRGGPGRGRSLPCSPEDGCSRVSCSASPRAIR